MLNNLYSASAYCACQLFSCNIRFTGKWATYSFNEIKQSSVKISVGSWCVVRVFIHASIHCAIVIIIFCHQVSFVFACPSRGTRVTTWYHHLWRTCGHMTHSTWNIVLFQTARVNTRRCLIFSSMDSGNMRTRYRFFINWIACQAYVVRSTAFLSKKRSSDITCRIKKWVLKFNIVMDWYVSNVDELLFSSCLILSYKVFRVFTVSTLSWKTMHLTSWQNVRELLLTS